MLTTELRSQVDALLADYAAALDERRYADWLELFAEDSSYVLQPRENFDQGLPLATMRLESKGMITDRIFGVENTLFHQPYYQRHLIGTCRAVDAPLILPGQVTPATPAAQATQSGCFGAQANYAVFRTKVAGLSEVFNVGRYLLALVPASNGLKIHRMHVVFDSELVPNSVIYPI
jgi:salicylate 5-hydroxylase small subunit